MSFEQFEINPQFLRVLTAQGITKPTPVQEKAIPPALEGRDLVAVAQTGTGKTLAFSLPALTTLSGVKPGRTRMLVLTPTRELAHQVHKVVEPLAKTIGLRTACVYGGVGMEPQTKALRRGVDIIIATPGRLMDHMERGNTRFTDVCMFVLDEADRMLDLGFLPAIRRIARALPTDRQTLLFSATFPKEISRLAMDFQHDPLRIEVGPISTPVDTVRQGVYTVDPERKVGLLSEILDKPEVESAIVFIRTKHRTDRVAKALHQRGHSVQAIHGGRTQGQRQQALDGFRNGRWKVLVATDVAARGIDIQGVTHVVNFDIPTTFDDYVHRIGRTARANATGDAITFVSPQEFRDLGTIEKALGMKIPQQSWDGSVEVLSMFRTPEELSTSRSRGARRPARRGRMIRSR